MIGAGAEIAFSPLLPWWAVAALAGAALLALLTGVMRGAGGLGWRLLGFTALVLALANPSLVAEEREPLPDIALLLVDESRSQSVDGRAERTEEAVAAVRDGLAGEPGLELRTVRFGAAAPHAGQGGTRLVEALTEALAEVPRDRLAGVLAVTDGRTHDADLARRLEPGGPVHLLLTGRRDEADRRIVVEDAPGFAIVGRPFALRFVVEDAGGAAIPVAVRLDGREVARVDAVPGRPAEVELAVDRAGPAVVELAVPEGPRELSLLNNTAFLEVSGVRDRLKVLLISGEPHPGARAWRRLLKSDPAVDLIHFTILRPPEKQDRTPLNELSLITFPVRELFEVKLQEFDLVIFDRYRRRGVLPLRYLSNIVDYVEAGGALMVAVGPAFATPFSLFNTPLGDILPAEPTGRTIEAPYRAAVTEAGRRHPVTAPLAPAPGARAPWGRWFREVDTIARSGTVLMEGAEARPLLVLDRVGEGRVAQLMSDHLWLWSRGYDGGGPYAELLRRVAHWLMKEPDLEENDLRARVEEGRLIVERRSLEPAAVEVRVTTPSGREIALTPAAATGGRSLAGIPAEEPGLYRVEDGARTAFAVAGVPDRVEMADLTASAEPLAPLAARTGGGVAWLAEDGMPRLRRVAAGRDAAGSTGGRPWLGLVEHGTYRVRDTSRTPLLPPALVLLLAAAGMALAWRREGR